MSSIAANRSNGQAPLDRILNCFPDAKENGAGFKARCPAHEDRKASLSIAEGAGGRVLLNCFAGCSAENICRAIGLSVTDLFPPKEKAARPMRPKSGDGLGPIVAEYVYRAADSHTLFRVTRHEPKDFRQWHTDPSGNWKPGVSGVQLVLFHLPQLYASDPSTVVCYPEGEKDVLNLERLGFVATTNAMGAEKWRPEYAEHLRDRHVALFTDNDNSGRRHVQKIAEALKGIAASIKVVNLPNLPTKGDVSDWIDAGGTREQLAQIIAETRPWWPIPPKTLDDVKRVYSKWLQIDDWGALEVTIAAVTANRSAGDPVWLLVIAPPGTGKTEMIAPLVHLPDVHAVAVLTEASLLSGTPKKDSTDEATGGLLCQIGSAGILLIKDFSGILSLNKDARGPILSALREIYDGAWTRIVGSDGGKTLSWSGKCGLIGGATPTIDGHHGVMASLGERFVNYRMAEDHRQERAEVALEHFGEESQMRAELADVMVSLFATLPTKLPRPDLSKDERRWLVTLADLAVLCRSAVDRDQFSPSREITNVPGAESPTRLVKVLAQIFAGLLVIGVERARAWSLVRKVALDSMPQIRRRAIEHLYSKTARVSTSEIATAMGLPSNTLRRALEDLTCYGIVERESHGGSSGDRWGMSAKARAAWVATVCVPERWEGGAGNSGTPNEHRNIPNHISGTQTTAAHANAYTPADEALAAAELWDGDIPDDEEVGL